MVDAKAMQAIGSLKDRKAAIPGDVLPRYMTMGSWKADLSMNGRFRRKGEKKS